MPSSHSSAPRPKPMTTSISDLRKEPTFGRKVPRAREQRVSWRVSQMQHIHRETTCVNQAKVRAASGNRPSEPRDANARSSERSTVRRAANAVPSPNRARCKRGRVIIQNRSFSGSICKSLAAKAILSSHQCTRPRTIGVPKSLLAAQPEEIAPAFVFLAAPSCSSYITGEVLPIIGGYSGG
jgi:hypothetical protein